MRRVRFSLSFAVLSAVALIVVLSWVLLSIVSFTSTEKELLRRRSEECRLLLTSLAAVLPRDIASEEGRGAARRFAAEMGADPDVDSVAVVDAAGSVLAGSPDAVLLSMLRSRSVSSQTVHGGILTGYLPLRRDGAVVGGAKIALSLKRDLDRVGRIRSTFFAYFVLDFILLLVIASILLSRLLVSPVRRLVAATERVAEGDLGHRVQAFSCTELAELADSFNCMVQELRREREEVARHVKSLEKAYRSVEQAREETVRAEKMASVGVLAAGMAHEIGTPLASILGYAGMIAAGAGEEECREFGRRIGGDASRIDAIVRGLLDYARPKPAPARAVEVRPLLQATVALLESQGALKRVAVEVHAESGVPAVAADPNQLEQVFLNFILNARDSMSAGGILRISIRPATVDGGSGAAVAFHDEGAGIAEDVIPRIFDPFFTTKEPGQGTGLGLAIASRIIDGFGGSISVSSRVGEGATFTLFLPEATMEGRSDG